jgi:hypothetical protein
VKRAITYTLRSNVVSNNNLIAAGYRTYWPGDDWADKRAIYWYKDLTK